MESPAESEAPAFESPYQSEFDPTGPIVKQLPDGRYVQRTPTDEDNPGTPVRMSTDVLRADARGCYSCHDSINDALNNLNPAHVGVGINQGVDTEMPITDCVACHSENLSSVFGHLSTNIHGIHNVGESGKDSPACFSCHEIEMGSEAMVLWDEVKYDYLEGISKVENVSGDFAFDQDTLTEGIPNIQWNSHDYDFIRWDHEVNGDPLDDETFDTWEISVSGFVNEPKTFVLGELVEEAPIVTTTLKAQCETNPLGGNMIGNVEVKGIPLDWVIEQCGGFTDEAVGITTLTPTGTQGQYYGTAVADFEGHDALIIIEMSGERLSWINGYPCALMIGGQPSSRWAKNFCEIVVNDVDYHPIAAGGEGQTFRDAKPNLGFLNTPEGLIVEAGKPYTFEGWADGWELPVTAMEFSMDGGKTWTRYDIPDVNTDRWVHWTYTWTPEAGVDTAYVLSARAYAKTENGQTPVYKVCQIGLVDYIVDEDERMTKRPINVMVNARTDMSSIEVTE